MNSYMDTEFVDNAIIFATKAHKNTERREKNTPYIIHPLEVLSICETMTDDKEVLAAAVLHDVIEDTDFTYDDILKEFGKRVADIVSSESDNELEGYNKNNPWKVNKELAIKRLQKANLDCKMVALSDKLSNLRAINRDYKTLGNKFWMRFHETDPKLHKWRFNALLACFGELSNTFAYKEFKMLVEDTFKDID